MSSSIRSASLQKAPRPPCLIRFAGGQHRNRRLLDDEQQHLEITHQAQDARPRVFLFVHSPRPLPPCRLARQDIIAHISDAFGVV